MNHLIHQIHPESAGLFADQLPRVAPIDYSHSRVAPKDLQVLPVGSRIIRLPRGITNCRRSYERCFTLRVRVPHGGQPNGLALSQWLDLLHQIGARA